MLEENIEFLTTKGYWGIPKREKSVALLTTDFEDFLEEHMRSLGIRVVKNPKLPNGRTPDFLIEFEGVKCYVEATSRPDIRDQILDAFDGYGYKPYTLFIRVLQSGEKAHLNRRRDTAREIIEWVDSFYEALNEHLDINDIEGFTIGGQTPSTFRISLRGYSRMSPIKTFCRDGYDWAIYGLVHFSAIEMGRIEEMFSGFEFRIPVGYPDVDRVRKIGSESRRKEDVRSLRHALRCKAVRYLPIPDGIGNVPLVIAVNDYDSGLVVDELLGTRGVDVYPDFGIALPAPRRDNGFWRRSAQSKRRHVKAVWHFDRARSDSPDFRAKFILNPDEGNARSILPSPLFSDPHTDVIWPG